MNRRFLKIQNFRNIGVTKDLEEYQTLYLNNTLNKDEMGELIILIGENNVGKSNILDAVNVIRPTENIKSINLKKDIPDFMDYEDAKPKIKLIYADENESQEIEYFLDENLNVNYNSNLQKEYKTIKTQKTVKGKEFDIEAVKAEFKNKFNLYESQRNTFSQRNYSYESSIKNISNKYYNMVIHNKSLDELVAIYEELKKLYSNFVSEYNNYYSPKIEEKEFYDLRKIASKDTVIEAEETIEVPKDIIKEKYDINFIPNIIYYKEEEVKDSDLVTTPENIKNSKFFNALFKAIGKNISTVETAYEKAKKAPGHKNQYQNTINQNLKDIVSKKFNELYFQDLNTQEYNFYITLEKDQIYLSMEKNGNIILLEQQSVGFKWFFNFFFNFLYSNELNPGDIVLMDEPEIHLSIPGRRDLRNFIKKFARNHGITFIITTHNPSFIDVDYLDELRIVRFKKDKIGVEIQNDFSAIGEDEVDTLNEIVDGFGVLHRDIITNPNNKVIFVEGLMDYNYLTAFKKLKEAKENKKINLVFLPIHGLGKDDKEMNNKLKQLVQFREAIILTDSDERANLFKKASESNTLMKERLTVFQLKEADQSFKEIESLFSDNDKGRYREMIQNKSGSLSSLFKNNIFKRELDEQTINNFNKLLDYLSEMLLTNK
ncbi:AAA family ATPase [Brachyspira innocens]|uniref:AAA family ATPase n=1 Tax=Brachyspira innocens TaxID=13264 RepID=UPI00036A5B99|nr:AAA family ATPase [Brachyspira innocens]